MEVSLVRREEEALPKKPPVLSDFQRFLFSGYGVTGLHYGLRKLCRSDRIAAAVCSAASRVISSPRASR